MYCVIVNWNGSSDTEACLQSLAQQDYPALTVVVVDNGSTDDSCARVRAGFPDVVLIEAGANLGFACGSNVGIRYAVADGAEFVWLLNNDTTAPPDTCSKLVAKAKASPSAGIIGSVLYYMQQPDQVQAWGGGELTIWLGRSTHHLAPFPLSPSSYLTFASVLIPSSVFRQIGVLYEGYFMYFDDSDFALRVTRAGYQLAVAEDTVVLHRVGGSAEYRSPLIDRFAVTAGLHFLRRNALVPLLSMVLFIAIKLSSRIVRRHWKNARAVLAGVGDYRRQRHTAYTDAL